MAIYTKTGDLGTTSLVGGTRVPKDDKRVMAYGDVDELISFLGIIRSQVDDSYEIRRIQIFLMEISAHFASDRDIAKVRPLNPSEISFLEDKIDTMTAEIPAQKAFILPGTPEVSSQCHFARTICRRAERSAVALSSDDRNYLIAMRYLNRLSDYLFTMARHICFKCGVSDDYWLPEK